MPDILDKLHQDHIHMAQILDVLESQLEILGNVEGDENADLDLIREIAHYFTRFPEQVHHVAEDKLFSKFEQVSPEMKSRFDSLRADHSNLSEVGKEFQQLMDTLSSGQVVNRDQLITAGERFLQHQREHMSIEEREIFPEAKLGLDQAHVKEIEQDYNAVVDPIFGPKVEDYFSRVHAAIVARQ